MTLFITDELEGPYLDAPTDTEERGGWVAEILFNYFVEGDTIQHALEALGRIRSDMTSPEPDTRESFWQAWSASAAEAAARLQTRLNDKERGRYRVPQGSSPVRSPEP